MANKQTRFSLSEMSNWLIKKLFFLSIIVFGAFLLLSFFSYSANDPYYGFQTSGQISNITGFFGAYIAGTLLNYFDIISILIPATLLLWGIRLFFGNTITYKFLRIISLCLVVIIFSINKGMETITINLN